MSRYVVTFVHEANTREEVESWARWAVDYESLRPVVLGAVAELDDDVLGDTVDIAGDTPAPVPLPDHHRDQPRAETADIVVSETPRSCLVCGAEPEEADGVCPLFDDSTDSDEWEERNCLALLKETPPA